MPLMSIAFTNWDNACMCTLKMHYLLSSVNFGIVFAFIYWFLFVSCLSGEFMHTMFHATSHHETSNCSISDNSLLFIFLSLSLNINQINKEKFFHFAIFPEVLNLIYWAFCACRHSIEGWEKQLVKSSKNTRNFSVINSRKQMSWKFYFYFTPILTPPLRTSEKLVKLFLQDTKIILMFVQIRRSSLFI